ncbi:MAG: hypothetical protein SWX82_32895 [Cyanobacteriota bacterium]|nr:hypothetical protein [Cyanobacteriota bacterium]
MIPTSFNALFNPTFRTTKCSNRISPQSSGVIHNLGENHSCRDRVHDRFKNARITSSFQEED